nr:lysozyme inhibitor LprI family protein [Paracoccus amoyensis]
MSMCLGQEYDIWDAKLNEAYQSLLSDAEATDKEMAELGSAAEKQVPHLRDMQRNWIAFRDAACGYERSRWGGGTGGGPAATECMMRLTAQQFFWLQKYQ